VQTEAVRIILVSVNEVDEVLADVVGKLCGVSCDMPTVRNSSLSKTALVSSSVKGRIVLAL
jgi:hypothetical protein